MGEHQMHRKVMQYTRFIRPELTKCLQRCHPSITACRRTRRSQRIRCFRLRSRAQSQLRWLLCRRCQARTTRQCTPNTLGTWALHRWCSRTRRATTGTHQWPCAQPCSRRQRISNNQLRSQLLLLPRPLNQAPRQLPPNLDHQSALDLTWTQMLLPAEDRGATARKLDALSWEQTRTSRYTKKTGTSFSSKVGSRRGVRRRRGR